MNEIAETGPGWYPLIDNCLRKIQSLNVYKEIHISQVKEKFGGLRIYYNLYREDQSPCTPGLSEKIDVIIREAESEAEMTCEQCGARNSKAESRLGHNNVCSVCKAKIEAQNK